MSKLIGVKYSKTVLGDPRLIERVRQPLAIAKATATHIKRRVLAGKTATPADAYSNKPTAGPKQKPRYFVSPQYAKDLGLGEQTRWASSAEMHRHKGIRAGTANATGEMWKGLQVRNFGTEGAIIDYGGSSTGASSVRTAVTKRKAGTFEVTLSDDGKLRARQVRELVRVEGGEVKRRRKAKKVRNSQKAGTVFKNTRVGLLQPTPSETAAQLAAVNSVCGELVATIFGGSGVHLRSQGDQALYRAILREFKQ